MHRWAQPSAISLCSLCIALATACDHDTEVQRQTRELEQAQKAVPEVTAQLEKDLTRARGDVVELEAKLALARQGLTEDVIENQRELEQALKDQQQAVRTEVSEAQREVQIHDRDTEAALKQLQQTGAPAPVAAAPGAQPEPGSPPAPGMPAAPPLAPSAGSEPVQPDEVVRVHGEDADAGVENQMTPPSEMNRPTTSPSAPGPNLDTPPATPPSPAPPSNPAPSPGLPPVTDPAPPAPN
jgi:hypothetical protein